jgi:GDP-L-fucose synthase
MLMSVEKKVYEQSIPTRNSHVNIGTGSDISIKELAVLLVGIIGYKGEIQWDTSKPDGTPRKLLDVSRVAELGWQASTTLTDGLRLTYQSYLKTL